uniref:Uncharacterized protein n=1 Tax=Setaria viridis TaxID=4556 RepID=A0A4U6TNV5_SETVI|nr:hypothetical protein SEVIR_7G049100v2 [Setaria viridis]
MSFIVHPTQPLPLTDKFLHCSSPSPAPLLLPFVLLLLLLPTLAAASPERRGAAAAGRERKRRGCKSAGALGTGNEAGRGRWPGGEGPPESRGGAAGQAGRGCRAAAGTEKVAVGGELLAPAMEPWRCGRLGGVGLPEPRGGAAGQAGRARRGAAGDPSIIVALPSLGGGRVSRLGEKGKKKRTDIISGRWVNFANSPIDSQPQHHCCEN